LYLALEIITKMYRQIWRRFHFPYFPFLHVEPSRHKAAKSRIIQPGLANQSSNWTLNSSVTCMFKSNSHYALQNTNKPTWATTVDSYSQVTDYRRPRFNSRQGQEFSLLHQVHRGSGGHPASYPVDILPRSEGARAWGWLFPCGAKKECVELCLHLFSIKDLRSAVAFRLFLLTVQKRHFCAGFQNVCTKQKNFILNASVSSF
jgi:hypothetical protein